MFLRKPNNKFLSYLTCSVRHPFFLDNIRDVLAKFELTPAIIRFSITIFHSLVPRIVQNRGIVNKIMKDFQKIKPK